MQKRNREAICRVLGLDPSATTWLHIDERADGRTVFEATVERRLSEAEVALIRGIEMQEGEE
jgi:hypothetical protein